MKFKVESNGKEIDCVIVFTFADKANGRNYIIYTDDEKDDDGDLVLHASRYKKDGDSFFLEDIENDYEWNLVDNMIKVYKNGSE